MLPSEREERSIAVVVKKQHKGLMIIGGCILTLALSSLAFIGWFVIKILALVFGVVGIVVLAIGLFFFHTVLGLQSVQRTIEQSAGLKWLFGHLKTLGQQIYFQIVGTIVVAILGSVWLLVAKPFSTGSQGGGHATITAVAPGPTRICAVADSFQLMCPSNWFQNQISVAGANLPTGLAIASPDNDAIVDILPQSLSYAGQYPNEFKTVLQAEGAQLIHEQPSISTAYVGTSLWSVVNGDCQLNNKTYQVELYGQETHRGSFFIFVFTTTSTEDATIKQMLSTLVIQ